MQTAAESVDTGASQGARRATEDAPVSTRPLSPSIDSEVVAVAKRRNITNADKRRIVLAAATCTKPGEIGALMRREGVFSSALAAWRRQYAAGELNGAEAKKRGPKPADPSASPERLYSEIGRLKMELDWLKKKSGISLP